MKKLGLALLLCLSIAAVTPVSAREPAILEILSASRVSGYLLWDAIPAEKGKRLKCLVSRGEGGEQLDVYLATGKENRLLFTQRLGERLVSLFTTAEPGGDLVVLTAAGSSGRAFIFSAEHGRIRKIFEEETKGVPELLHLDGDEKPAVVTFVDGEKGRPLRGVVHRWNGKKYAAGAVTPEDFLQRFQKPKMPEPLPVAPSPPGEKSPEGKPQKQSQ